MDFKTLTLIAAATSTALMAGTFYAYTISVIPGLAKVSDGAYVATFQQINREIQNPYFFAAFFGTLVLLPLASWMFYSPELTRRFWFLAAGSAAYLIGVMAVTIAGNIPLNNALDAFNLEAASGAEITAQRIAFESRWNMLNLIRTLSSTAAAVLVILACLSSD